jgi:alkanesulfonate monooxygenase SsuD/methylene tetrahydromethanopterin reductase-like flavin-dependent oxidoreductase (luciferase family)
MPQNTDAAVELYRSRFEPSEYLQEPYVMVACAALAAEDDERARYLSGPARLSMARLRAGRPTRFPTPEEAAEHEFTAGEEDSIKALSGSAAIGGPETVRAKLDELRGRTGADELMITTMVHDHADRIRSYELIAETYDLPKADAVGAAAMEDR